MTKSERPADAIVNGGSTEEFWTKHTDVRHVEHAQRADEVTSWEEWSLWLEEPANDTGRPFTKWAGAARPERQAELTFENAGHSPPPWFWQRHPDVVAFAVEYDPGDGANWWASIWTNEG